MIESVLFFSAVLVAALRLRYFCRLITTFFFTILCQGFVLHLCGALGVSLNRSQIVGIFPVALVTTLTLKLQTTASQDNPRLVHSKAASLLTVILLMLLFLGRCFASNQTPNVLTQLTYLTGEDNAAWIEIASAVTRNQSIAVESIASGPLVVLICIANRVHQFIAYLGLIGNKNELAEVSNTVVISYWMLILAAPSAVASMLSPWRNQHAVLNTTQIILGSIVTFSAFSRMATSGHLTAILVLLVFMLLQGAIVGSNVNKNNFLIAVGSSSLGFIWLPLVPFSLALLLYFFGRELYQTARSYKFAASERRSTLLAWSGLKNSITLIGIILNLDIAMIKIRGFERIKELAIAGGLTEDLPQIVLIFIVLLALILALQNRIRTTDLMLPVTCSVYLLVITSADSWITGTLHYGSRKALLVLGYFVLVALILDFSTDTNGSRLSRIATTRFGACILIVFAATSDTGIVAFLRYIGPSHFEESVSDLDSSWRGELRITNTVQKLQDLPVGCVLINDQAEPFTDFDSYQCTRRMLSIAGLTDQALNLRLYFLRPLWGEPPDKSFEYLKSLSPTVMKRNLLLLSEGDRSVVEIKTVEWLVNQLNRPQS